jgi:uncharacterized membrane protein YbjE (DUF340 family)
MKESNTMENIVSSLIVILFIGGMFFLFSKYINFLVKFNINNVKKKIDSGKINDKKLIKMYKNTKMQKNNVILAIFMAGIFYKSYLKIPSGTFELFEKEMINRNLPLE